MGMTRRLMAWALVAAQGLALAQTSPPAASALADGIKEQAAEAMFWADWDELERLHAAAKSGPHRGKEGLLVASCRFAFGVSNRYEGESQSYHDARVASTLDWVRRRPESPLAHAVHLSALADNAWFIRGVGYAKTVSDQRFAEFRAKVNEALAYANAHSAVMARDSYYVSPLLTLLRSAGVSVSKQLEIARQAMRKDARDECIYQSTIDSLMPKWGGEPEQLERWIRESMKGLPDVDALKRYTRLYNTAAHSDYEQSLFDSSLARWPLMRDGLRAILAESPNSRYWKSRLGYFACMAKDREAAAPALEAIEATPDFEAWGSTGQRNYQACKRWALQS